MSHVFNTNLLNKYTRGQMLKIQDTHRMAIFDHLDLSVFDEWDSLPGGKLAAILFDDKIMHGHHLTQKHSMPNL